jgi:hypothetical protein
MKLTLPELLHIVIDAAWRRRYLLLIPILLSSVLGIIAAYTLPRTYVARSLLLLQESPDGLMAGRGELTPQDSASSRIGGLQALLKSERVILTIMRDLDRLGLSPPGAERMGQSHRIRDLQSAIQLEVAGNDFLEFRLRGNDPAGMGRRLEVITTRFLESMIAPEQNTLSAPQMLMDRRKAALELAETNLADFKVKNERVQARAESDAMMLGRTDVELRTSVAEREKTANEVVAGRARLGDRLAADEPLDAQVARAQGRLERFEATGAGESAELRSARVHLAQLTAYRAAVLDLTRYDQDIARLVVQRDAQERALRESRALVEQERKLETALAESRQSYQVFERRFGPSITSGALQILRAPERIKVIDYPKDPELPLLGRATIVLVSLLIGCLLAGGLAALMELIDVSVRRPDQMVSLSGERVFTRLPRLENVTGAGSQKAPPEASGVASGRSALKVARQSAT